MGMVKPVVGRVQEQVKPVEKVQAKLPSRVFPVGDDNKKSPLNKEIKNL
jgi:hypothetical protein